MTITYAIGDIHGCRKELDQLFGRISDYHCDKHLKKPAKLVFLGDYIDRGPDSKGVIHYLIGLARLFPCIFLRGNHEDMLLNDLGMCLYNGGTQTLASYGYTRADGNPARWIEKNFPAEHMAFLKATQLFHKDEQRTYVHAGIMRGKVPIERQPEQILLWVREEFLCDPSQEGGFIVHGHTPTTIVDLKPNRVNLDTGCVFSGRLTAAVFDDSQAAPIDFLHSDRHERN